MPIIYLKHPRHGSKVAMMEFEAEADEKNGWVRYDPTQDAPADASEQAEINAVPVVNALATPAPRRGRPPRSATLNH